MSNNIRKFLLPHRVIDFPTQKNFETVESKIEELISDNDTLRSSVSSLQTDLNNHKNDQNNPHNTNFIILPDTPSSYEDKEGYGLIVNNNENGLDFSIYNGVEMQSRTIYVDPVIGDDVNGDGSASAPFATIQHAIDTVKKIIPYGVIITIQLGLNDGSNKTFNITSTIEIVGFWGGGDLIIRGDDSDMVIGSSKKIKIDCSSTEKNALLVSKNMIIVRIKGVEININTSASWVTGIKTQENTAQVVIEYCAIRGNSSSKGYGVSSTFGNSLYIGDSMFSNIQTAILANNDGFIRSFNNDDYGTLPTYGLQAARQARIRKEGTQPNGSVANENSWAGGEIE